MVSFTWPGETIAQVYARQIPHTRNATQFLPFDCPKPGVGCIMASAGDIRRRVLEERIAQSAEQCWASLQPAVAVAATVESKGSPPSRKATKVSLCPQEEVDSFAGTPVGGDSGAREEELLKQLRNAEAALRAECHSLEEAATEEEAMWDTEVESHIHDMYSALGMDWESVKGYLESKAGSRPKPDQGDSGASLAGACHFLHAKAGSQAHGPRRLMLALPPDPDASGRAAVHVSGSSVSQAAAAHGRPTKSAEPLLPQGASWVLPAELGTQHLRAAVPSSFSSQADGACAQHAVFVAALPLPHAEAAPAPRAAFSSNITSMATRHGAQPLAVICGPWEGQAAATAGGLLARLPPAAGPLG